LIYENAIAFIFARLFNFFNFNLITFDREGLDAQVSIQDGEIISLGLGFIRILITEEC